jgi:hypothetical protein
MRTLSGSLAVTSSTGSKGDTDTPFSPAVLTPSSFRHPVMRMQVRETPISTGALPRPYIWTSFQSLERAVACAWAAMAKSWNMRCR